MHFKGWYFWKIRIVFTWELRNPDFIKIESQEGWTFLSAQPQQDHTLGAECTSGALIFLHWGAKALLSGAHWPDKRYALSSAAIWTYEMRSSSSVPSLRRNCFFFFAVMLVLQPVVQSLSLWSYLKFHWPWSWATYSSWPWVSREAGLCGFRRSLPT